MQPFLLFLKSLRVLSGTLTQGQCILSNSLIPLKAGYKNSRPGPRVPWLLVSLDFCLALGCFRLSTLF